MVKSLDKRITEFKYYIYIKYKKIKLALTQMQIIQSLGKAMSWFERELEWGVGTNRVKTPKVVEFTLVPTHSVGTRVKEIAYIMLKGKISENEEEKCILREIYKGIVRKNT